MDDTKKTGEESNENKASIADQMTNMLATAAGALAETAVKTVASGFARR
jgi:hypothetical protein